MVHCCLSCHARTNDRVNQKTKRCVVDDLNIYISRLGALSTFLSISFFFNIYILYNAVKEKISDVVAEL